MLTASWPQRADQGFELGGIELVTRQSLTRATQKPSSLPGSYPASKHGGRQARLGQQHFAAVTSRKRMHRVELQRKATVDPPQRPALAAREQRPLRGRSPHTATEAIITGRLYQELLQRPTTE